MPVDKLHTTMAKAIVTMRTLGSEDPYARLVTRAALNVYDEQKGRKKPRCPRKVKP